MYLRVCEFVCVFVCLFSLYLCIFVSTGHLCATIMLMNPVLYTVCVCVCVLSHLSVKSVHSHVLL